MSNYKQTKKEQYSPEPEEDPQPLSLARSSSPASSIAPSSLFDASSAPSSPYTAPPSPLPPSDEKPKGTKRSLESSEDIDAPSATERPPVKKLKSVHDDGPRPSGHLKIKRHSPKARVPTRGSALAAGYDLYSAEEKVIPAKGKAIINTQISIVVPPETYGRVAPRSGLAAKYGIDTGAGVIDADYRGILYILLFNLGDNEFKVSEGDRIAQLIIERIYTPEISEVEELEDTVRGNGGFGSTGGHVGL